MNAPVREIYNDQKKELESLDVGGVPVDDARQYTLGLIGYHADNCTKNLGITMDDLMRLAGIKKMIATSTTSVLEECLRAHPNLTGRIEGRLVFPAS